MTHSDRDGRPPLRAPVAIVHRQSGDPAPLPPGPAYILWWAGARAIGHVWRHGDEAVVPPPPPPPAVPTAMPSHGASVVICTRDRPEALARCLASLTRQTLVPAQVIVVDNASQGEATRQVAMAANVTYRREDRAGLDIARNTGAGAATGDIVVYTDDDVETTDDWLRALVAAFDDPSIDAACGLVLPAVLETEAQLLFEREWGFGRGYASFTLGPDFHARHRAKGVPSWRLGAGANMAFRRSRLLALGGFDERLDVGQAGCSGDSELWYRILAGGGSCRYVPDAIVFHHHRCELATLESQIFHYMRGHVAALLVQYERTREIGNLVRAGFVLPRYYLRRAIARAIKGPAPHNAMLGAEIRGAWSGLRFYLKAPRPPYDAVPR